MADQNVRIESWPKEPAGLSHQFNPDSPCQVRITFETAPAHVVIKTEPERPLDVNMNMGVTVKDTIPVCIKLCEPICAQSDYRIGIDVFDRPVASISIKGLTRLFNCRDMPRQSECVDFKRFPGGQEFPGNVNVSEVTFISVSGPLRTATYGEPAGQSKLAFSDKGIRIELPGPSTDVSVTICNFGNPDLLVEALSGGAVIETQKVSIQNATERVNLKSSKVTAVNVTGGSKEAAIVEVCYTLIGKRG